MQVEKLEKGMAKLTIEVSAERFNEALKEAYKKSVGKINIPGFRKGKAPMGVIEKMYGTEIFYEDAANIIIPDAYDEEVSASDIQTVARPHVEVEQIEKGKSFIFTATVAIKPEVTLGQYKGIEVEALSALVSDDEVMESLKAEQEKNAVMENVEDKASEDGNTVTIDFEGFVDGEAFEGGKGTDYPLVLGSHSFIDTFEEQLVGKNVGDEVDVNVTFPENYQAEELAGKPALFKVTVKKIEKKILPEIDDELAQDVSEFDTLDELKADIKKQMNERKAEEAKNDFENQLIEQVIDNMECEVPKCMFDKRADEMVQDYAYRLQMQGIDLDTYLKYLGQDKDAFKATFKDGAEKQVKASIALEAIVEAEKLEATEEEIDAEIAKLAEQYQMEADQIKKAVPADQIAADVKTKKAIDIIVDSAVKE